MIASVNVGFYSHCYDKFGERDRQTDLEKGFSHDFFNVICHDGEDK